MLSEHERERSYSAHPAGLYSPPSGPPPGPASPPPKEYFDSQPPSIKKWPMQSQRVWAVTPLRAFIIIFDIVFASTPIMFIGTATLSCDMLIG